jgi:hypothetical protein
VKLEQLLKEVREAERGVSCPPEMEWRLREAVRARGRRSPVRSWLGIGALACAALALVMLVRAPEVPPAATAGGQFVVLDPAAVHGVPDGYLVRVQVPREAMGSLGVRLDPALLPERVDADLLLGSDGMARAIRFLPASRFIDKRRSR